MKITQYLLPGLIAGMMIVGVSCEKRDIKGEVVNIGNVTLSLKSNDGQIKIPEEDTSYIKTPEDVTFPIEVKFSDAVPKRFQVGVSVDNDTINKLIAENKLPNTVLLQSQYYKIPSNLDVRFGLDHYDFNLVVDVTPIESNYGKNLALAIALHDPTKNNQLDKATKKVIIVINTSKVISKDDIHYIYFTKAGGLANIPESGTAYPQNGSVLTVPIGVSLGGVPAGAFNVRIAEDQDTVQKLISSGVLKDVHPLVAGTDYRLPDSLDFPAKQSEAKVNLGLNVDTLVAHYNEKVALALTLEYPTGHLLDSARRTVVAVLDPVKLVEFDITSEGTFSTQRDGTGSEIAANLVDNDVTTKLFLGGFNGVWFQLEFPTPQVVGAYSVVSANDNMTYTDRNINAWSLLGSDDGAHWTTLDTEAGNPFTANYQIVKFYFNNTVAYKYYRLDIASVTGGPGAGFQLSGWHLIRTPVK
jgi:hypothetical protein